jgi:hypothetical protein
VKARSRDEIRGGRGRIGRGRQGEEGRGRGEGGRGRERKGEEERKGGWDDDIPVHQPYYFYFRC